MALSPSLFGRIASGSRLQRQYDIQESIPLAQTKGGLSDPELGSPFVMRIVPPQTLINPQTAQRQGVFDRLLADQRAAVAATIPSGTALSEEQLTLLGTRVPYAAQVDILSTALKASNNFDRVRQRQDQAAKVISRRSDDSDVPLMEPMITRAGQQFDPIRDRFSSASNQLAVADVQQARSVWAQLQAALETPPLTLLINPQNLTTTYTKKQSFQDRTRFGYLFQSWGEDQVKLSVQGKTGAFVAGATGVLVQDNFKTLTNVASGVQWATRRDSVAFQNMMNLFTLYMNNGYLFDQGTDAHWWIGSIQIEYDQFVYQGNFDSFSYSYNEQNQLGGVEFSFEFTVSAMFDTAQRQDVYPQRNPDGGAYTEPQALPSTEPVEERASTEGGQSSILNPVVGRL